MNGYLGALVATTLLGGLIRMLAPEGAVQKYLRLTVSLCLVCALLCPLLETLSEERSFSLGELFAEEERVALNYDEIYDYSLQNATRSQAEKIVRETIYQRFSLSEETASVRVGFVTENNKEELSEVYVSLRASGVLLDPNEVVLFVREEWDCPCVILYE